MKRVPGLILAFVAACSGTDEVTDPCNPGCGEGFDCTPAGNTKTCTERADVTVDVEVLSPASGDARTSPDWTVRCDADAPQLKSVIARFTGESGLPVELDLDAVDGGFEWTGANRYLPDAEDILTLVCVARYGPAGFEKEALSEPIPLLVDKTGPTVTHTASTVWMKPTGHTPLTAVVRDEGASASGVTSARIEFETEPPVVVNGVAGAGDAYSFDVDLAAFAATSAPTYRVVATDRAGNQTSQTETLLVDGEGPVVTRVNEKDWYRRNETVTVAVSVSAVGAQLTSLVAKQGSQDFALVEEGGVWSFSVPASSLVSAGAEQMIEFEVVATDDMGNVTKLPVPVGVDDKSPSLTVDAPSGWTNRAVEQLVVTASEGGSGLGERAVTVGGVACMPDAATAGRYTCTVDTVAAGATNPALSFEVKAQDSLGNVSSKTVSLQVDRKPPTVTHTSPAQWVRGTGTHTLSATVTDGAAPASGLASVRIEFGTSPAAVFQGTAGTNGAHTFDIVMSALNVVEATVGYTLIATDLAGNENRVQGSLKVDSTPPTVTPVADESWHPRSSPLAARANASSTGAPVVAVFARKGTTTWPATLSGGVWTASVPAADIAPGDVEGQATVELVARDEAGNEATTTATYLVDGKAPTITTPTPTVWVATSPTTVVVSVSDAGRGMDGGSVQLVGGAACTKGQGTSDYSCQVPFTVAANTVNASVAYEVLATDSAGNARTAAGTLKVDKKGPAEVTPAVDGKWYARGQSVTVRMKVADEHAGFAGAPAPTLEVTSLPTSTRNGTVDTQGNVIFVVETSDLASANTTRPAIGITMRVFDALGNASTWTTNSLIRVDDQKPAFSGSPTFSYASGRTNALRRDPAATGRDRVTITISASDSSTGSGVTKDTVSLAFPKKGGGTERVAPVNDASPWSFLLDVATAEFEAASGALGASIELSDTAGNAAVALSAPAQVTRVLWEYNTGTASPIVGAPALNNGSVFVTAARLGGTGAPNLFAIDASAGQLLWGSFVGGTPTTPVSVGVRKPIASVVVFRTGYFAYVTSGGITRIAKHDLVNTGHANQWTCSSVTSGFGGISGALALAEVDFGDAFGQTRETVFGFADDGNLWGVYSDCATLSLATSVFNDAGTVSVRQGRVWVGGANGRVATTVFSKTGFTTPGIVTLLPFSNSVVASGVALRPDGSAVVSVGGSVNELSVLPASTALTELSQFLSRAVAPPVLRSGGDVLFGSDDGLVFQTPIANGFPANVGAAVKGSPVIDAEGRAYVATEDGRLKAVSASGGVLWSYSSGIGNVTASSPALSCSGVLYAGTSSGKVVALIADAPIANTPWPKFQHDNRNTGNAGTVIYNASGVCQD